MICYVTMNSGEKYEAICGSAKTRNGFRHYVEILKNGEQIAAAGVSYCNRTWERFPFETAINRAIGSARLSFDKAADEKKKNAIIKQIARKALKSY